MKRMIASFMLATMLVGCLAGCGSSTETTTSQTDTADAAQEVTTEADSTSTDESAAESTEDKETVELNYLTWRSQDGKHPENLIAAFEDKYPYIKVNYQVIKNKDEYAQAQQVRLLSGADMDLCDIDPTTAQEYIEAGYLLDLTGSDYLNNYLEGSLDGITADGKTYGIAGAINLIGVYYNKTMFEENGIKVPTNYQEYMDAMEAFKQLGMYSAANGGKDGWPTEFDVYTFFHDLMIRDVDIFSKVDAGEVKYTDPIFQDVFDKIETYYKSGYVDPDFLSYTGDDAVNLFVNQKVPMLVQGEWQATVFDDIDLDFEMGVFPVPAESADEVVVPVSVGNYVSGITTTEHPEEVKLFLEFMSSEEGASLTANGMTAFSPVKGVGLEGESKVSLFNSLLNEEKSVPFFYSCQNATDNSEMLKLLQELSLGTIDASELTASLQEYHDSNN